MKKTKKLDSAAIVAEALSAVLLGLTSFANYVFTLMSPDHTPDTKCAIQIIEV